MKNIILCLTILMIIVSFSIGQERRDVIYLKNGDVIKGIIIENVFNDYVRIELVGGSILSYKYVDIESISKEPASQLQTQSPYISNAQKTQLNQETISEDSVSSPTGISLVGGINYSTVEGDDIEDVDNLMGFRFGIENTLTNGNIVGATYSQRGSSYSDSESSDYEDYSYDNEFIINYLTGYVLFRLPMNQNIDLLVGPEFGYFLNGKTKSESCYNGDCVSNTEDIDGEDWEDADNNMIDYGLVIGGRFPINEQMFLVGTYYIGFADMNDDSEVKNRSFQIYISYALK